VSKWLACGKKRRVILIQAFSKYYKTKGREKAKSLNTKFLGRPMQAACGVTYVPWWTDYNPYKHGKKGAGRRHHYAVRLARRIARLLRG